LLVSKEFQPLSSGVARHIQGLAQALSDNHEIAMKILAPNVEAASAPCPVKEGGYSRLWALIGASDVVHVHGARTPFAAVAGMLARLRGVPLVYTPHCYYDTGALGRRLLKTLWDKTIERALMAGAGAVVLLHQGWVADLARRGLYPARVMIIPNCIDDQRRLVPATVDRIPGAPALLSVGRLDPVKRIDDVIAALATSPLAHAVLHIIGRGEDRPRLEAQARNLGLADRVCFHGWQDDVATQQMMAGCNAMVLASEREGMPTVVLEALLAGVPIACSDIEGCRSITDTVGWKQMFAVADIAALAECVARTARSTVPDEVIEAVKDGFTWQRKAPQLAAVYADLATGRHPSQPVMKRLARHLSNYENPRSLGSCLRAKRIGPLLAMIDQAYLRHGHVKLIDVGGTQRYWNILPSEYLDARHVSITLVNLGPVRQLASHPRFTLVQGDGCDLRRYEDQAFHVAHSNSVIEHVGGATRVASFARELKRVAEHYFIQTPDFWCPLEPHCMTPLFHWLPHKLRTLLVRRLALGHWPRARNSAEAHALVDSAQLLTRRELQALLPDARIIRERVIGLPKSLIAVNS
jgi:glycosyltransferase involved in cell wall biosynthesis